ncbi:Predicted membrane protein [Bryocella elongata]|uniref:Predicted membrane protein n=1 Tax=Bryocella elongata TaxID=863522 RepID=A0A1H5T4M0_9BACT|nr:DUF2306 domain-containing protein [Bryocella elongata]SEF57852.1 Predicted membrane protein [Bryocella elongata]
MADAVKALAVPASRPPGTTKPSNEPGSPPVGRRKLALGIAMTLAGLWVLITTEVALVADDPLYHSFRLQAIADRYLLLPHAIFGGFALLSGPMQFSSRLRRKHLKLHRVLGRMYVISVFCAAPLAFAISWGRTLFPGTLVQGSAWIVCTAIAFVTARNRQIAAHRAWMMRSYAVTFTFISLRLLDPWPKFWNMSDAANVLCIIITTFASILAVDIGLNWRELTTRRS